MIMGKEDVCRVAENHWLKYFTRMHHTCTETANTHGMDTNHFVFLVEHQHNKVLPIHIGKIRMYERTGIDCTTYLLVVAGYPTFPDQAYPIHRYAIFSNSRRHVLLEKP